MNREVKMRKKRFSAFCLALVLLLCSVAPITAFATEYQGDSISVGSKLQPGDVVKYYLDMSYNKTTIIYYDTEGEFLKQDEDNAPGENYFYTGYTILGYAAAGGDNLSAEHFKEWEVIDAVAISSGTLDTLKLKAVSQTKYDITYHNVENATHSNPACYYEGSAEIVLTDAEMDGYDFDGWYSDAALTEPVRAIPAGQTGAVDLYAKFTAEIYGITYELNGGTNAESNPAAYTYGVGVASLADAEKDGYVFDGWYGDESFDPETKMTSIPADHIGPITLYAKFVESSILPPPTGDNGHLWLWIAVLSVSGMALLGAAWCKKRTHN